MTKYYKNLLLTLIIFLSVSLVVFNYHKNKFSAKKEGIVQNNQNKKNIKCLVLINSNSNIKSAKFSLNNNNILLSNIALTTEENLFGFKNIYKLFSLPQKIIKLNKNFHSLENYQRENITKTNNQIKNFQISFVSNRYISYSNYINTIMQNVFSLSNIVNSISSNNLLLKSKKNMFSKSLSNGNINHKNKNTSLYIKGTSTSILGIFISSLFGTGLVFWSKIKAKFNKIYVHLKQSQRELDTEYNWYARRTGRIRLASKEYFINKFGYEKYYLLAHEDNSLSESQAASAIHLRLNNYPKAYKVERNIYDLKPASSVERALMAIDRL